MADKKEICRNAGNAHGCRNIKKYVVCMVEPIFRRVDLRIVIFIEHQIVILRTPSQNRTRHEPMPAALRGKDARLYRRIGKRDGRKTLVILQRVFFACKQEYGNKNENDDSSKR